MSLINETHDLSLSSWLTSANAAGTDFPIQNLPFAVMRRSGTSEPWSKYRAPSYRRLLKEPRWSFRQWR